MSKKYNFINSRVTELSFKENITNIKRTDSELNLNVKVEINTNIPKNIEFNKNFKSKFRIHFDIKDSENLFDFKVQILSIIELNISEEDNIDCILEDICIPDLLSKSREMISSITSSMNIGSINLPEFPEEDKI